MDSVREWKVWTFREVVLWLSVPSQWNAKLRGFHNGQCIASQPGSCSMSRQSWPMQHCRPIMACAWRPFYSVYIEGHERARLVPPCDNCVANSWGYRLTVYRTVIVSGFFSWIILLIITKPLHHTQITPWTHSILQRVVLECLIRHTRGAETWYIVMDH